MRDVTFNVAQAGVMADFIAGLIRNEVDFSVKSDNGTFTITVTRVSTLDAEVICCLMNGKKIGAIKLVRDRVGGTLVEAKDYVETVAFTYGVTYNSTDGRYQVVDPTL